MKKVKVHFEITAKVEDVIELEQGESLEDFKNRHIDIYLHGARHNNAGGAFDKTDLGADFTTIKVLKIEETYC